MVCTITAKIWIVGHRRLPSLKGLCMVGDGFVSINGGKLRLFVVLKLSNVKNSDNITDLTTGTLESLNSSNDSRLF